ncbi:hypothetical protein [Williamsia herbipolensis]|uniref:hypothetical protein n=1 Tax=Williamsia herbipolensis TaxID=1603258 RepID=UPI0005F88EA6|nr:hypothetical protein [Williamsia herbipolensis]
MTPRRSIASLVVCLGTLTACTDEGNSPMVSNDEAHQQIITRFQELADGLSWPGATLTVELPGLPNSEQTPNPAPCNGNDDDPDQPYRWQFAMWVLLPADTDAARARTATADTLTAAGWTVTTSGRGVIDGTGFDGYTVNVLANPDTVPVSISSPCFPKTQLNRAMQWPRTITGQP